jgi:hypothetical protein
MATLTVALPTRVSPGLDCTGAAAAAGGDAFANTGQELLLVTLVGSACTVTVATGSTVDGLAVSDPAIVCPINKTTAIGPVPAGVYNDANGLVQLTYSAVTAVTVKGSKVVPA